MFAWIGLLSTKLALGATLINGAGASFPYPIYAKWFSEYGKVQPEVQINYQSIGSGGGIRQFQQHTVDFGASDAPMTEQQLKDSKGPVLHIPTVLGAVAVTYHVPGLSAPLKLSGDVLGAIFQGAIKKWSDPQIQALNPGVALPATGIVVVHRADGSGTTQIFTEFLTKTAKVWKAGTGTSLNWPAGLGGKGNEGVAAMVKQTPGAIGYVELVYAKVNGLPVAQLRNAAGTFVEPDLKTVTAAAEGVKVPPDFRVSLTNAPGKQAYPISAFTYLLVWKNSPDSEKGKKFTQFLRWAVRDGQKYATDLHYAPLPKELIPRVEGALK